MKSVLVLLLALPFLAGCTVFESLIDGLAGVDRQFDNQPQVYVARVSENESGQPRYLIDRITIAENREGRAAGVRFEGLRELHMSFPEIGFPGFFLSFALRPDGERIVAVVEEDIVGDLETYLIITDTVNDRRVRVTTLIDSVQTDMARLCGVSPAFYDRLQAEVEEFGRPSVAPGTPLDVTLFATSRTPGQLVFTGWSPEGDPVFDANFETYAEVRVNGEVISSPAWGERWLRGAFGFRGVVRFSANSGALLDCDAATTVPAVAPLYDVRRTRGANSLTIIPPGGGAFPVFDITGRSPLFVAPVIDGIVGPYE